MMESVFATPAAPFDRPGGERDLIELHSLYHLASHALSQAMARQRALRRDGVELPELLQKAESARQDLVDACDIVNAVVRAMEPKGDAA